MTNNLKTNFIYNDDCLNTLRNMPDNSIDAIVTDPPYLFTEKEKITGLAAEKTIFTEIEFMSHGYNPAILDECVRVMKSINITLFSSLKQLSMYFEYFKDKNCSCQILTWCKTNPSPLCGGTYLSDTEYILHFHEGDGEITFITDHYLTPTVKIPKNDPLYHLTTKPINILKDLITAVSDEGDIILDPFMGSGSTAAACIETGRYFIGCELDAHYFNVCKMKISKAYEENPEYNLKSCLIESMDDETAKLDNTSDNTNDIENKSIDMAYIDIVDDSNIPYDLFNKLTQKWLKRPNMYIHLTSNQLIELLPYFEKQKMKCNIISNWQQNRTTFLLFVRKHAKLYGTYKTKRKYYQDERDMTLPNQDNISYGLMQRLIINSSLPGEKIFCLGGLGTCISVCIKEKRRFIAYDKDYRKILQCIKKINISEDDELQAA